MGLLQSLPPSRRKFRGHFRRNVGGHTGGYVGRGSRGDAGVDFGHVTCRRNDLRPLGVPGFPKVRRVHRIQPFYAALSDVKLLLNKILIVISK